MKYAKLIRHTLLACGLIGLVWSGSTAMAAGRPYVPVSPMLLPVLPQFAFHSSAVAGLDFSLSVVTPLASGQAFTAVSGNAGENAADMAAATPTATTAAAGANSAGTTETGSPGDAASTEQSAPTATPESPAPVQAQTMQTFAAQPAEPASSPSSAASAQELTAKSKKVIYAVASAYTADPSENGGYAGLDYFGNKLQVGTIAVDPNVIPLGSTVFITGYTYNGLPQGGLLAKALDTGGSIKGNRIDIFVPGTSAEAKSFAYQNVTVYVVD